MSDIIVTVLFDCILGILLIATINYCSKLSKRIRLLQDSRGELAGMISQFDTATQRAMTSLGELQTVSKRITEALQLKIDKANFLADDLAFLIEKSAKLATQLEQAKAGRTPEIAPKTKAVFEPALEFEPKQGPQLVKPKPITFPSAPAQSGSANTQARSVSSLEAVLQRLSANVASGHTSESIYTPSSGAPRTSAERELLEALKSGQ